MWIFRQSIMFVRFAFPHAIRVILSGFGWAFRLIAVAIIALGRGVWPTAVEIAEHWVEEALAHGFPSLWERRLRIMFRILATLTILIGWVTLLISGYFTAGHVFNLLFQA